MTHCFGEEILDEGVSLHPPLQASPSLAAAAVPLVAPDLTLASEDNEERQ